jgi:hypothetical protein
MRSKGVRWAGSLGGLCSGMCIQNCSSKAKDETAFLHYKVDCKARGLRVSSIFN